MPPKKQRLEVVPIGGERACVVTGTKRSRAHDDGEPSAADIVGAKSLRYIRALKVSPDDDVAWNNLGQTILEGDVASLSRMSSTTRRPAVFAR